MYQSKNLTVWKVGAGLTAFDGPDNFAAHEDLPRGVWYLGPGRNRDSGPLDNSNFESALAMLGGERATVRVLHLGHWAVGWVDQIIVSARNPKACAMLESIAERLENYPVLDEEDFSAREMELAAECWDSYGRAEFRRELERETGLDLAELDPSDEAVDEAAGELRYGEADGDSGWSFRFRYRDGDPLQIDFDAAVRALIAACPTADTVPLTGDPCPETRAVLLAVFPACVQCGCTATEWRGGGGHCNRCNAEQGDAEQRV